MSQLLNNDFLWKCPKTAKKKIEIGQNVQYDAVTHSNAFIIVENNVFLDFDVISAHFENCVKFQETNYVKIMQKFIFYRTTNMAHWNI